jgi:RNA polymerase sigma-70 factor (ECF subfamily)
VAREALILARLGKDAKPAQASTEDLMALKEVQSQLQQALAKLSFQQKLVFTLSREKGLKYDEIAAELNISPSTVKNHMIDALRIIRQHFHSSSNLLLIGSLYVLVDTLQKIK